MWPTMIPPIDQPIVGKGVAAQNSAVHPISSFQLSSRGKVQSTVHSPIFCWSDYRTGIMMHIWGCWVWTWEEINPKIIIPPSASSLSCGPDLHHCQDVPPDVFDTLQRKTWSLHGKNIPITATGLQKGQWDFHFPFVTIWFFRGLPQQL